MEEDSNLRSPEEQLVYSQPVLPLTHPCNLVVTLVRV